MLLIDSVSTCLQLHNAVFSSPRMFPIVVPDRRMTVKDSGMALSNVRTWERVRDLDPMLAVLPIGSDGTCTAKKVRFRPANSRSFDGAHVDARSRLSPPEH